jgi:hypothetical protein
MTDNTSQDTVGTETPITPEVEPGYFQLTTPLETHGENGKTLTKLLIDPRGKLKGKDFFALVNRCKQKFPNEAKGDPYALYNGENFLALVIAKLNGITPEDLYTLPYEELPLLFMAAGPFQLIGILAKLPPGDAEKAD